MIRVNELVRDVEKSDLIERVLWIDESNEYIYLIDINSNKGFPRLERAQELINYIECGQKIKLNYDPYFRIIKEEELSFKDKEIRDKAWNIVGKFTAKEYEPQIFDRSWRGKLIKELSNKYETSVKHIYKYFRRLWQRGKTKNSLLPDYINSGGNGKLKTLGNKKLGRPRKYKELLGNGINVDETTKRIFRIVIEKYYLNSKRLEFTLVYRKMIKEYYEMDFYFENNLRKTIPIPEGERPSLKQFRDFYKKEYSIKETTIARLGRKKFEKDFRAVLGSSNSEVLGPGSRYQIDASIMDVYVVSRFNRRWIVGRPIIYIVVDVFSRMIVGFYIGFEGPSWAGAMMAMLNVVSNKVEVCRDYGITINESEWPCAILPDAILGDRGEWEGKTVGNLSAAFGVTIENAASYRADWKGVVERKFRLIHGKVKPFVSGYIDIDFRERGGTDYRLDAKLDIQQITEAVIQCIRFYNNKHWMTYYDRDEMLIEDDVLPIPIELWNWGIKNRSGRGKSFPEDVVKLNLLPSAQATVTQFGIKYKNIYYSCEKAIKECWFEVARNKGTRKVDISFDCRNMNYIYLPNEDRRSYDKCYLLDDYTPFIDKTVEEIDNYTGMEKLEKAMHNSSEFQAELDLDCYLEDINKRATEETNKVQDPTESKRSKLKDIKIHQKVEREINRKAEAFNLDEESGGTPPERINNSQDEDNDNEYRNKIKLLKSRQREVLYGKEGT
jgi:hypothetical protein